jgi:hypothetical protein
MTDGGPWHARRLSLGDAYMSELEVIFKSELQRHLHTLKSIKLDVVQRSDIETSSRAHDKVLEHAPYARLLIFRKSASFTKEGSRSSTIEDLAHIQNKL